jgi:hypothetical protein
MEINRIIGESGMKAAVDSLIDQHSARMVSSLGIPQELLGSIQSTVRARAAGPIAAGEAVSFIEDTISTRHSYQYEKMKDTSLKMAGQIDEYERSIRHIKNELFDENRRYGPRVGREEHMLLSLFEHTHYLLQGQHKLIQGMLNFVGCLPIEEPTITSYTTTSEAQPFTKDQLDLIREHAGLKDAPQVIEEAKKRIST